IERSALDEFKRNRPLSISDAAAALGISISTLRRLEKRGHIVPQRAKNGSREYTQQVLDEYRAGRMLKSAPAGRKALVLDTQVSASHETGLTAQPKLEVTPGEEITATSQQTDTNQLLAQAIALLSKRMAEVPSSAGPRRRAFSIPSAVYTLSALAIVALTSLSIMRLSGTTMPPPTVIVQQVPGAESPGKEGPGQIAGELDGSQERRVGVDVGTAATDGQPAESEGLIAGIASSAIQSLNDLYQKTQLGRERAISIDDRALSYDLYQPAKYLYVDLREDGTYFKVQDHGADAFTVDFDKNIIAHKGSTLHLQGVLKDHTGSIGEGEQVFAVMGDGQLPAWTDTSDITAGNLECADCLGPEQIKDIFVHNTGDTLTGGLVIQGSSNETQLSVKGVPGQSANLLEVKNHRDQVYFSVAGDGATTFATAAFNCADCIDFDDLEDVLDLDASTEVNFGANNLSFDLDGAGDFIIADAGTAFATFADDGSTTLAGSDTSTLLTIDQNGNGLSLDIDSESTTADIINLSAAPLTTGRALDIPDLDALTTGTGVNVVSNSSNTSERYLVNIVNDNTLATSATALRIQQDAAAANALITTGGLVGFGTTAPVQEFHLVGQCVTGDTRLKRRKRQKCRKHPTAPHPDCPDCFCYEDVKITDIKPGDEILSLNEETGEFEPRKVKALMDMGKQVVFELVTESGKRIETTGNHPYLVAGERLRPDANALQDGIFAIAHEAARSFYFETILQSKAVKVPALNNENVSLSREAWEHLQEKNRSRLSRLGRYAVLPHVLPLLVDKNTTISAHDIRGDVEFWSLRGRIADTDVQVVVRSIKGGPKHLYSLMRKGEEESAPLKKELSPAYLSVGRGMATPQLQYSQYKGALAALSSTLREMSSPFGRWRQAKELKVGQYIATLGSQKTNADQQIGGTSLAPVYALKFEKIKSIKPTGQKQTYDIAIAHTHNFVGNNIVAHNTFIDSNASDTVAID
ncbi:MAG: MerR family DNA-binding transcriptional regulator, partial [Candidatus Andersenbacteria bacterium]|nr:MerR family DNA-binding transcriptional regulator [Candidatus Andersenbacteria bacterium]